MQRFVKSGAVALAIATVLWSFTGIFVKHFVFLGLDGNTQNLFRYLAAALGLWAWVGAMHGPECRAALAKWRTFLLPAAVNCVFQTVMVSGLYRKSIYPGFMSLLSQAGVLFATGLAFLLFRDERRTIRSTRYLVGCALAIAGVTGVVMFREPFTAPLGDRAPTDFSEGVGLILLSAFLWACYTLAMKPVVRTTRPAVAFTYVATYTTVFFVVMSLWDRPARFLEISALDQFWVVLSGVACISVAHSLYFAAVSRLGVAVCACFILTQPLLTNLLSAAFFGERLTALQCVMGVVLLAGACLVILAKNTRLEEE